MFASQSFPLNPAKGGREFDLLLYSKEHGQYAIQKVSTWLQQNGLED